MATRILKILAVLITLIIAVVATVVFVPSIRHFAAKRIIASLVQNDNVEVSFGAVKVHSTSITLDDIHVIDKNTQDKKELLYVPRIDGALGIHSNLTLHLLLNIPNAEVDNVKFRGHLDWSVGRSKLQIKDMQFEFDNGASIAAELLYDRSRGTLNTKGELRNVDSALPKIMLYLAPQNSVFEFLSEFIVSGNVDGKWDVRYNLGSMLSDSQNHILGDFNLHKLHIKYDADLPSVREIDATLKLAGATLDFDIHNAASDSVSASGKVVLDLEKNGRGEVLVDAAFKGSALAAISYIPKNSLDSLRSGDIDLSSIKGSASGAARIIIPLSEGKQNTYDISGNFNDVSLNIFSDMVQVSGGKLNGKFDGKEVSVGGVAEINGFSSKIDYKLNIDGDSERDQDLKVAVKCNRTDRDLKFIVISDGSADLYINYWLKGDNGSFAANANLTSMDFLVDKISLYKPLDKKAYLKITSTNKTGQPSEFALNLTGEGLNIAGLLTFNSQDAKIRFSKIKYNDTEAAGEVAMGKGNLVAKIKAAVLDLSHSHMMKYLKKDAEARATELDISGKRVKLKHDIWLDNFYLYIRCDKKRCYEGNMSSSVGSRDFNMTLGVDGETEKWVITTTNAGAIMKAIGLYDNIKSGELTLTLKTSRQHVRVGEEISIIDGDFLMERFVTTKTPFLTRLVSFVSFPGLISAITGNDNISFTKLKGKFNYKEGVIYIKDCHASGAFFDFSASGNIDTNLRKVTLKGSVVPSLYGINTVVKNLPIVGRIFSGTGHRKGLFFAPYKMEHKY